ncbi:hypothetical protein [Paenibacillus elgii]|uniref:hypothetical protein n=1 Tax=Paenibacillus elgii TaxID=189691 RepID=UPI000248DEE2|nr:hypothetical protein [Paenibacillus elgii]
MSEGVIELDSLAEKYRITNDTDILIKMYKDLQEKWSLTARAVAASLCTDSTEVYSMYNEAFIKSITSFKGGNFSRLLSKNLKNARASFYRKQMVRLRRQVSFGRSAQQSEEDAPTSDAQSDYNLEAHANERMHKKKEADQRQLVDFLLDRANDPVTTLIVTKFREDESGKLSITALAKALGLHHEVVRRKLRALSRHYDANRFGDIEDYIAV